MRLGRVFSDYMVLQRGKPILIWGESERRRTVSVRLDGVPLCEREVGCKAWEPWDRWLTYNPENAPELPAVARQELSALRPRA